MIRAMVVCLQIYSFSSSDTTGRSTSADLASAYEGEQSHDETSSSHQSGSRSLADVLKYACSEPSTLARKRKVQSNPPKGAKRCRGQTMNDPKKIPPSDRVRQYPEEPFEVSAEKCFCGACREEVSMKSSIISQHIKSAKHNTSKEKCAGSAVKDTSIVSQLEAYDKAIHPVGEQLPLSTRLFRVKTLTASIISQHIKSAKHKFTTRLLM